MKPNELMVGDWVYQAQFVDLADPNLGHGWKPVKVTSIPFDKDCFIEPIPLTGEILEKNFRTDKQWGENGWFVNDHIHIYQVTSGIYNIQYMEIIDIQYVHELQHALKLCGIDKNIEL